MVAMPMGLVVAVKGGANTLAYHATIINFFGEYCVFVFASARVDWRLFHI